MTTSLSVILRELSTNLRDHYRVSGIGKLISDGAVIACYPLHDGTRYTTVSFNTQIDNEQIDSYLKDH